MATIRRLTDSCLLVSTHSDVTLLDPGFHTFQSGEIDLESIGDVSRVLITHEHADHVNAEFVRWLIDRSTDLSIHANQAVVDLLEQEGIEASTDCPEGVSAEDVLHGRIPNGAQPPNRAFTLEGLLTHPGDSREPSTSAPVLALPLIVPWDSATGAADFARRLGPRQVVPIHDFYLSKGGREFARRIVGGALAADGIEMVELDWGESFSV